jgi:PAT family beta-lactamase induction signal transducer AmpG
MLSLTQDIRQAAGALVLLVIVAFVINALRGKRDKEGVIANARSRWGRRWAVILAFVCVFRLGDHLLGFFLFPSLSQLGFSAIEIATVAKSWGLIATIIGTLFGGWLVYRIGLMRVMVIAGLAQALSNLTLSAQALLGHSLPFLYVSIGVQDFALGMVNATFVAYISSLCDRRYAATHFAFLSALSSVLKTFIQAGSGWVVSACKASYGLQGGWALYFALTSALALPGLILLLVLMRDEDLNQGQEEGGVT